MARELRIFNFAELTNQQKSQTREIVSSVRTNKIASQSQTASNLTELKTQPTALRVLIVEDSPTQAKLLNISMKRLGIDVEWLGTLGAVLMRLKEPGIDVVLLDLSLPDSTGLETFHRLHALNLSVPIVVLTGLDDQRVALEAVKSGAQDYLVKGRASDDSIVRCLRYAVERNRIELALRETERRTRLIIENSLDAFLSIDADGEIIDWNLQAEKTFGWKRNEAIGKHIFDLIGPSLLKGKQIENLEQVIGKDSAGMLNKRQQIRALHKDGHEFPVEYGFFRINDGDDYIYCSFVNDITERLELEQKRRQINEELERRVQERTAELQRSNEELHQFAKITSHDLQEPLRSIEGFAQLLVKRYKDKFDKDAADFIEFILDGTKRMEQLIQAVLAHSRIGMDEHTGSASTDVNSVLKEVLANLSQSIAESHATFNIGSMPTVAVERSQLIQLFQNLISNAIKYTGANEPKISISAELNVKEWLFSVQDNGIGIDSRYAERIFDMFARLHGHTKYSGTGMGLAICKKIVTTHGGRIWMESEVGKGSIFFFTLSAYAKE